MVNGIKSGRYAIKLSKIRMLRTSGVFTFRSDVKTQPLTQTLPEPIR